MSEINIVIAFFLVVLGCLSVAAVFLARRAEAAVAVDAPAGYSVRETLKSFGALVPKRSGHVEHYRKLLAHAGYRHTDSLTVFFGIKAASIMAFCCILSMASLMFSGDSASLFLAIVAGAGWGHLMLDQVLRWMHKRRDQQLRSSLPIAMELMILGLEAGQSMDSVIAETARELNDSHPEIAEEFHMLMMEILASRGKQEALRDLIDRNTEPELKRIGQVLIDGDRFGTGLASSLRNQLRFLRTRSRQAAQEQARKVSVKLVFPIFFLIFPAILLVTLGPAIILIFNALGKMMNG